MPAGQLFLMLEKVEQSQLSTGAENLLSSNLHKVIGKLALR